MELISCSSSHAATLEAFDHKGRILALLRAEAGAYAYCSKFASKELLATGLLNETQGSLHLCQGSCCLSPGQAKAVAVVA